MRWAAQYRIAESPGYALIEGIVADSEEEARAWAAGEVGTDLHKWGASFRLLALDGVIRTDEEVQCHLPKWIDPDTGRCEHPDHEEVQ